MEIHRVCNCSKSSFGLIFIIFLLFLGSASAIIIQVPQDYSTIQAAIDAASHGDEIIVAPARYVENIFFNNKNIILRSQDPTDVEVVASTIIDGSGEDVVTFGGDESPYCRLSGFLLTGGKYGITSYYDYFTRSFLHSRAIVENNIIEHNSESGIHKHSGDIISNTIRHNSKSGILKCRGKISGNTISHNSRGGIASCYPVVVHGNIISQNTTISSGGGIYESGPNIYNNIIVSNHADFFGGGLYNCPYSSNNTIYGNSAGINGGGVYNTYVQTGSYPSYEYSFTGALRNSIVWANTASVNPQISSLFYVPRNKFVSGIEAVNNCIQGYGEDFNNILVADPGMVDPANGDFRLLPDSPCINMGLAELGPTTDIDGNLRPWNGETDIGAYESGSELPVPTPTPVVVVDGGLPALIDLHHPPMQGSQLSAHLLLLPESMDNHLGGDRGVAFGDIDGDGRDDLLLASGRKWFDTFHDTPVASANAIVLYGEGHVPRLHSHDLLDPGKDYDVMRLLRKENTDVYKGDYYHSTGSIVSGDFNGDGIDDLIFSRPDVSTKRIDIPPSAKYFTGAVDIVYGSRESRGAVIDLFQPVDLLGETRIWGCQYYSNYPSLTRFGWVLAAGDLNADGYDDVLVGSPWTSLSSPYGGKIHAGMSTMIFGSPDMTGQEVYLLRDEHVIGETKMIGHSSGDQLGRSVAVGDFNGDGYDDAVIGAPHSKGNCYIVYGSIDLPSREIDPSLSGGVIQMTTIEGDISREMLGRSVAVGDLNGDGYKDLAVASIGSLAGGISRAGKVHVFYGDAIVSGTTYNTGALLPSGVKTEIWGATENGHLGLSLAIGDINSDGIDDLLMGSNTKASGYTTLIYGSHNLATQSVINLQDPPGTHGEVRIMGDNDFDGLGAGCAVGGDFNFDGYGDFLLSAPDAQCSNFPDDTYSGKVYLFYGLAQPPTAERTLMTRAGAAPCQDFGPVLRCEVDFNSGDNPSSTRMIITRQLPAGAMSTRTLPVYWEFETNRLNYSATLTLQYTDKEIVYYDQNLIDLYYSPSGAAGSWSLHTSYTRNPERNQIIVHNVTENGYFALDLGRDVQPTPTFTNTPTPTPTYTPRNTRTMTPTQTYTPTVTPTHTTIPDGDTVSVFVLDAYGAVHTGGQANKVVLTGGPYFGWDIARGMELVHGFPTTNDAGIGAFILDGYGGVHTLSCARPYQNFYFAPEPGDIASDLVAFQKPLNPSLGSKRIEWKQVSKPLSWLPRTGHTATEFQSKMWIMGGSQGDQEKNDVWNSIDGINWTLVNPSATWAPRSHHSSFVFNNKLWLLGGEGDSEYNDVWSTTDGIQWEMILENAPWPPYDGNTTLLHDTHPTVIYRDKIWIISSHIWCSSDAVNWEVITPDMSWMLLPGYHALVFKDKIWVIGGLSNNDILSTTDGVHWNQISSSMEWDQWMHYSDIVVHEEKAWLMGGFYITVPIAPFNEIWCTENGIEWTRASHNIPWNVYPGVPCQSFFGRIWVLGDRLDDRGVWYTSSPPLGSPGYYVLDRTGGLWAAGEADWQVAQEASIEPPLNGVTTYAVDVELGDKEGKSGWIMDNRGNVYTFGNALPPDFPLSLQTNWVDVEALEGQLVRMDASGQLTWSGSPIPGWELPMVDGGLLIDFEVEPGRGLVAIDRYGAIYTSGNAVVPNPGQGPPYFGFEAARDLEIAPPFGGLLQSSANTPASTTTYVPTPTRTNTPTPTPTFFLEEYTVSLNNLPVGAQPLVLVRIPSGSYKMGRYWGEQDSKDSEAPQHQVDIGYQFQMGKYEVTKGQWEAVMGTTPWMGKNYVLNDYDSPAVYISWDDAQAFVVELNKLGQGLFSLPSESEWEYAYRAGTTARYHWGDDFGDTQVVDYSWVWGDFPYESYAHVVGTKLPNAWGLYDMGGNVSEWCEDDWHSSYSETGRPDNGSAWIDNPRASKRVKRGSGWRNAPQACRSANRSYQSLYVTEDYWGFRLVRVVIPTPIPTGTFISTNTPTPTPTSTDTFTPAPTPTLGSNEIIIALPNLPQDAKPLVMVKIDTGSFMMGRLPGEQDSNDREDPQHQVNIGYQFYMGKYEITKAQWEAVMNTTPWQGLPYVLNHQDSPAVYVSWNDIKEANGFLEKLNALGQGTFRLPSEAEWEYCCRASTTTRFNWGDDPNYTQLGDYAWYWGNCSGEQYAHVVGLKLPNAWGLFDMHGNAYEWCEDWWRGDYDGAPADGSAWTISGGSRMSRGGSWHTYGRYCRSANRYVLSRSSRHFDFGLRVVREDPAYQTPTPTPTPTSTAAPVFSEFTVDLPGLPQDAKPLVLVNIPAGSFMMGRYPGEQDSIEWEAPQHQVDIGYAFYIGKYEITKAQWEAVMGKTPWDQSEYVLNNQDSPAIYISWSDCQEFVTELNKQGQGNFRLPSEAERQYACRAGTTTRFYWGDDPSYTQIGNYAWHEGNAKDVDEKYAHVVGLKLPNAWGLHDMSGNAREWCEDDWHSSYSEAGRPDNGSAWIDSPHRNQTRVYCGGSWRGVAQYGRCANRAGTTRTFRYAHVGLRIVRQAP
jgi:formylglycine-generating enzyme required for sulfatase activity